MNESTRLKIIKEAILLEKRGKVFFENVAEQTKNDRIKKIFLIMAAEEESHIEILSKQFKLVNEEKPFDWSKEEESKYSGVTSIVIDKNLKNEIKAADYEAAAISAAISMEMNTIRLYSQRSEEAEDEKERALYSWLANWEKTHLEFLAQIDKDLCEDIWYENQFWPF